MDKLWVRAALVFIVVAVGTMSWTFGLWWTPILFLATVHVLRAVNRRMPGRRLADTHVPRFVAIPLVLAPIALALLALVSVETGGHRPKLAREPASPASLRAICAVRIGPPFGGFRVAFRPGVVDWPEGFAALEAAVGEVTSFLARLSPEERSRILDGETPFPEDLVARLRDRLPAMDLDWAYARNPDGGTDLVLRGRVPFSWWPLGEWVVFQGIRIRSDNASEPFSEEELARLW